MLDPASEAEARAQTELQLAATEREAGVLTASKQAQLELLQLGLDDQIRRTSDVAELTDRAMPQVIADMQGLREEAARVGQMRIDPSRYYASLGSFGRIMAAVAIGFETFAHSNNPNVPLIARQMLSEAVDRDIDAQRIAIAAAQDGIRTQGSLLSQMMEMYGSEVSAVSATRILMMEDINARVAQAQAAGEIRATPDQVAAHAAGVRGELTRWWASFHADRTKIRVSAQANNPDRALGMADRVIGRYMPAPAATVPGQSGGVGGFSAPAAPPPEGTPAPGAMPAGAPMALPGTTAQGLPAVQDSGLDPLAQGIDVAALRARAPLRSAPAARRGRRAPSVMTFSEQEVYGNAPAAAPAPAPAQASPGTPAAAPEAQREATVGGQRIALPEGRFVQSAPMSPGTVVRARALARTMANPDGSPRVLESAIGNLVPSADAITFVASTPEGNAGRRAAVEKIRAGRLLVNNIQTVRGLIAQGSRLENSWDQITGPLGALRQAMAHQIRVIYGMGALQSNEMTIALEQIPDANSVTGRAAWEEKLSLLEDVASSNFEAYALDAGYEYQPATMAPVSFDVAMQRLGAVELSQPSEPASGAPAPASGAPAPSSSESAFMRPPGDPR